MITIERINLFAISLPVFILITAIFFGGSAVMLALLSTIITGFIQVTLGLILLVCTNGNAQLIRYVTFVTIYFLALYAQSTLFALLRLPRTDVLEQLFYIFSVATPVALAIYFTKIIYDISLKTQKKQL